MPLDFEDSLSQYVSIPNEPSFDITAAISVMAWVKVESLTRTWQAILTKGDNSWRLHRHGNNNGIALHLSGLTFPGNAGNINDGLWHHVAGTWDGANIIQYVDAVALTTTAAVGSISLGDFLVNIGENAQATGRYWDGLIDDARVYSRGLSGAEIATIYGARGVDGIVDGLVSKWRMKELASGVAATVAGSVKDAQAANNGDPIASPVYGEGILRFRRKVA